MEGWAGFPRRTWRRRGCSDCGQGRWKSSSAQRQQLQPEHTVTRCPRAGHLPGLLPQPLTTPLCTAEPRGRPASPLFRV